MTTPSWLPCPFCGGRPWISEDDHGNPRWVSCDICECDGPSWLGWIDGAPDVTGQTLIAAWNQRQPTPRTLTPDQVERAKKLVRNYDQHVYRESAVAGWLVAIELLRELVGE